MSLVVFNRQVTREQLEKNVKTLHDYRNYTPVMAVYSPPGTVGFTAITANENVYRAGQAIVNAKKVDREVRLRRIRLLLDRQRREKKLHNNTPPSLKPTSSLAIVRNPNMGYA